MADDRKDSEQTDQDRSQNRGQQPAMDKQDPTSPNQGGGMSGQPIGGNDSNTGSGTTMSAGYTPASNQNGAAASPASSQGSSDQSGQAAATQTMDKADHSMAEKDWDKDQNSGGSGAGQQASRDSQAGFVGSQSSDRGDDAQRKGDGDRDENAARSQDRNSDQTGSDNSQ